MSVIQDYHESRTLVIEEACTIEEWNAEWPKIGFELELEVVSDDRGSVAERILDIIRRNSWSDYVYAEHDGSLNYGFELVTAPARLSRHLEIWRESLQAEEFRIFTAAKSSCGLHTHLDKKHMSDAHKNAFSVFFNRKGNSSLIKHIAGRYGAEACDVDHEKSAWTGQDKRHEIVNWYPGSTVEVRAYSSTRIFNRLSYRLEFSHAAYHFTKRHGSLDANSFIKWVDNQLVSPENITLYNQGRKYPNLLVKLGTLVCV